LESATILFSGHQIYGLDKAIAACIPICGCWRSEHGGNFGGPVPSQQRARRWILFPLFYALGLALRAQVVPERSKRMGARTCRLRSSSLDSSFPILRVHLASVSCCGQISETFALGQNGEGEGCGRSVLWSRSPNEAYTIVGLKFRRAEGVTHAGHQVFEAKCLVNRTRHKRHGRRLFRSRRKNIMSIGVVAHLIRRPHLRPNLRFARWLCQSPELPR
jgi:hypothetical protein